MSLVLFEGFDFYSTADMLQNKYPVNVSNCQFTTGRTGQSLILPSGGLGNFVIPFIPSSQNYIVGFAFKFSGNENPLPNFIQLCNDGITHVSLTLNSTGTISTITGSPISTTTVKLSPGSWYYIEISSKISDTSGSIAVQLNGSTIVNMSPVNSYNSTYGPGGNAKIINWIEFVNLPGSAVDIQIDDLYCIIPDAISPNTFLGPVTVETVFTRGVGPQSQWIPSQPLPNWQLISVPTDGQYVSSETANATDIYQFGVIDNSKPNNIIAADVNILTASQMGAISFLSPMIQVGGSYYQGTAQAVNNGESYMHQIYTQNPNTGQAWTISEFNGTEFGFRRTN